LSRGIYVGQLTVIVGRQFIHNVHQDTIRPRQIGALFGTFGEGAHFGTNGDQMGDANQFKDRELQGYDFSAGFRESLNINKI
jgi:hypothetical protein